MKKSKEQQFSGWGMWAAGLASMACAVSARGAVFPDADSSHDISSTAAWDGAIPEIVEIDGDGVIYNATSGDVTFGSVELKDGNKTFDLTGTPTRKVTVNGGTNNTFRVSGNDTEVELKGGTWYFPNTGSFSVGKVDTSSNTGGKGSTLTLSGGCVVTNAGLVRAGTYAGVDGKTSKIVVRGSGTHLHSAYSGSAQSIALSRNDPTHAALEILEGGRFTMLGAVFNVDSGSSTSLIYPDARLTVSGEDSYCEVKNFELGKDNHYGLKVEVLDQATLDVQNNLTVASGANSGDNLFIVSNATLRAGNLYFGKSSGHALPNRMEVLNGASVEALSYVFMGQDANSCSNQLFVSNATVTCKRFSAGYAAGAFANRALFTGASAQLNTGDSSASYFFNSGCHDNEVTFTGGATWTHAGTAAAYASKGATNNIFRIADGATANVTGALNVSGAGDASNRVEVLGGEVTTTARLNIGSDSQVLVVSNGTVSVGTDFYMGYATVQGDSGVENKDCRLEVKGAQAQVDVGGTLYLKNAAAVSFDVPADGYGQVPVRAVMKIDFESGCKIEVDATAFRKSLAAGNATVVLMESPGTLTVPDQVLSDSNALLDEGLSLAKDGNQIVLTVTKKSGFCIFVR